MALSYGLNRGANQSPDKIVVGTQATSTYDVELRINTSKALTHQDIILILEAFARRLEDGRNTDLANI